MNNWSESSILFDSKEIATSCAVKYFPNCKNKTIVMMPSTTCYDLIEMKKQNIVDESTIIYNVDNLKSKDFKNVDNSIEIFKRKYRENIKKIFGNDKLYKLNKNNFILKQNIQNIPLSIFMDECDLVYADTCCTYNDDIRKWISNPPFLGTLKQNGVFALTVTLNRYKINYDICLNHNYDIHCFNQMEYSEKNIEKLKMIASDVEKNTNNILETKALIHYFNTIRSQMGILIFQKIK